MTTQNKRVAIVTGGGSGLGLAIAEKFTQAGIETIIVGRDQEKLKKAKGQLGDLCHTIVCDVSDLSSVPAFVSDVLKKFGQIDILVNNAGINGPEKKSAEITTKGWDEVLDINLKGCFMCSREAIKKMLSQKWHRERRRRLFNY